MGHLGPAEAVETRKDPPLQPRPGTQACGPLDLGLGAPEREELDPVWSFDMGAVAHQYSSLPGPLGQVGRLRAWGTWTGSGEVGYQLSRVACVQALSLKWASDSMSSPLAKGGQLSPDLANGVDMGEGTGPAPL